MTDKKNAKKKGANSDPKEFAKKETIKATERDITSILPCQLSEKEIGNLAREAAKIHGDIAQLKDDAKAAASGFKTQIAGLEARLDQLNRRIESGREDREVACILHFDYSAGTKTMFRKDDNSEVGVFTLSPEERQMKLPINQTAGDRVVAPMDHGPLLADVIASTKEAKDVPAPGDQTGTDDVRTPAAESPEEMKVRVWFNGMNGKLARKKALCIENESAEVEPLLTMSYKKLSEADKEIVRGSFLIAKAEAEGK